MGRTASSDGFVEIDSLYEQAQDLGFSPFQVQFAIERATEKELLEVSPRFSEKTVRCRVTTTGAYTVERLVTMFAYFDAMTTDTPIVDPVYRSRIGDAHRMVERTQRAEYFRTYLNKQWEEVGDMGTTFDWSSASDQLGDEIWALGRKVDPEHWPS